MSAERRVDGEGGDRRSSERRAANRIVRLPVLLLAGPAENGISVPSQNRLTEAQGDALGAVADQSPSLVAATTALHLLPWGKLPA